MHCQSLPAGRCLCCGGRPGSLPGRSLWQQQERGLLPPIPTERPRLRLGVTSECLEFAFSFYRSETE